MARGSGNKAGISGVFGAVDRPVTHAAHEVEKMCTKNIFKPKTAGVLCESSTILTSSA